MAHWLFLPDDAMDDLIVLGGLSNEQITKLRNHFDSVEFQPKYNFYTKVAELLRISDESAAKLCAFVSHVQGQKERFDKNAAEIPDELDFFL